MSRSSYETDAEELLATLAHDRYLTGAGLKATAATAEIYERYRALFDPVLVRELLAERSEAKRHPLAELAVFGYLDGVVRPLTDQITNADAAAAVFWDSRPVPYREVPELLGTEADAARRHSLERLFDRDTAARNPLRERRWERLHEAADRLGFRSYRDLCDEVRGLDLESLSQSLDAVVAATDDAYLASLDQLAFRLNTTIAALSPADVSFVTRASQYDAYFPRHDLVPAFDRTLRGLGFRLESLRALTIDLEDRPLKAPEPFCAAVRVPGDVRLVALPRGGAEQYRLFLHEAGQATHWCFVNGSLPFADRRLIDPTLTEAFAGLFERLLQDPRWLRRTLGDVPSASYFEVLHLARLHRVRWCVAQLHYEQDLHGGAPLRELPARYVEQLQRRLLHGIAEVNYLAVVDAGFASAHRLRAWLLEAQLRRYLERELDEDWAADPRAGELLFHLWERGGRAAVAQVASEIGFAGLEGAPLIAELAGGPRRGG